MRRGAVQKVELRCGERLGWMRSQGRYCEIGVGWMWSQVGYCAEKALDEGGARALWRDLG